MVDEAQAGDIVLVNGIEEVGIGVTLADPEHPEALPLLKVDEPTLTMNFQVNTSPLAGREGKYVTSRQMRERLRARDCMSNVALRVEDTADADMFVVSRPRRAAPDDPAREHAPRRLRARGVAPARRDPRESTARSSEPYEMLTVDVEDSAPGRRDGSARRAAAATCRTCSPTARAACASTTASRRAA